MLIIDERRSAMRTTITIDDSLYNKAADLADPHIEKSALLRECVKAYIELQSARRLAALGGTIPAMKLTPRRNNHGSS